MCIAGVPAWALAGSSAGLTLVVIGLMIYLTYRKKKAQNFETVSAMRVSGLLHLCVTVRTYVWLTCDGVLIERRGCVRAHDTAQQRTSA